MIKKLKKHNKLLVFLMYLETLFCAAFVSFYVRDMSIQRTMAVTALSLVLCTAFLVALAAEYFNRELYKRFSLVEVWAVYGLGLLIGIAMLYEPEYCDTILVLPVIMGIVAGVGPAIAANAVVLSLVFLWDGIEIEVLVFYLIIGIVGSYMSRSMVKKKQVIPGMVTLFCTFVLTMCVYVFFKTERINVSILAHILLGGVINILSLIVVLPYFYNSRNKENNIMLQMLSTNYELMDAMIKHKKKVYAHAAFSSNIAERAAEIIEADPLLTKCSVYYYNYARTLGKNFTDAFIETAYWRKFPQSVTDIVLSLAKDTERPLTREAAIILVTETLVLAKEAKFAGEQAERHYLEAVMNQRFHRGILNLAEISVKDYITLKEFVIGELCKIPTEP